MMAVKGGKKYKKENACSSHHKKSTDLLYVQDLVMPVWFSKQQFISFFHKLCIKLVKNNLRSNFYKEQWHLLRNQKY